MKLLSQMTLTNAKHSTQTMSSQTSNQSCNHTLETKVTAKSHPQQSAQLNPLNSTRRTRHSHCYQVIIAM
jgi:hypothetical protein